MNREVRLESIVFEYSTGLTIRNLQIDRRSGFGEGPFLEAKTISVPFSGFALAKPAKLMAYLFHATQKSLKELQNRQAGFVGSW